MLVSVPSYLSAPVLTLGLEFHWAELSKLVAEYQ